MRDTERRCGMQLRTERVTGAGRLLGMPAGCRRALPILADVGGWTVKNGSVLEFGDKAGNTVLAFAPGENELLLAKGPEGETYELIATGRQRLAQANPSNTRPGTTPGIRPAPGAPGPAVNPPGAAQTPPAPARQSQQAAPQAPAQQPTGPTTQVRPFNGRPAEVAGRYIIMREPGKDVGCMLTLNDQARGPGGSFKAQLAPACRDNGIVVFDPLGWTLERGGRLALTARKGHKAHFDHHEDGSWWKDPKEGGKPLGVKKMER